MTDPTKPRPKPSSLSPVHDCPECGRPFFWHNFHVLGNFGRGVDAKLNPDGTPHVCKP
jgi:hypothetical protein